MTRTIPINDRLKFEIAIYNNDNSNKEKCFFTIRRLNSYKDAYGNTKEYWGNLIVSTESVEELMMIGEHIVKAAQLMVLA